MAKIKDHNDLTNTYNNKKCTGDTNEFELSEKYNDDETAKK